jgi:glycosyltransferase involved in cell wall biosynthesis
MISSKEDISINIIASATYGTSISGGDKIFIEFAKNWAEKGYKVNIYLSDDGLEMCRQHKLENVKFIIWASNRYRKFGPILNYIFRTIKGLICAYKVKTKCNINIIYSASDFLPDCIPSIIMNSRLKNTILVSSLYLFAPNPLKSSDIAYRGGRASFNLKNLVYLLSQKISYFFILRNSKLILVANELDKKIFVNDGFSPKYVIPVYGGVDLKGILEIQETKNKKFDGCFVGRLHPQKGPLELIKIWELVCKKNMNANLAIIGDGPLENQIKKEIIKNGLEKNIFMFGYIDGKEKYQILKNSKIFLHTPILDTGGMAAAEAMACGLPVVGFDLPGYKYCYPHGMLKVEIKNIHAFSEKVIELLENPELYNNTKNEAVEFSKSWDWPIRAESVIKKIEEQICSVPESP